MPGVNSGSRHGGSFLLGFIVGGGCREIRYRGERKGEAGTTKIRQDRHEFSLPDSRSLPQLNFEGGRITIACESDEVRGLAILPPFLLIVFWRLQLNYWCKGGDHKFALLLIKPRVLYNSIKLWIYFSQYSAILIVNLMNITNLLRENKKKKKHKESS